MVSLHTDLASKGLEIVGVPSTQFNQESGTNEEVAAFCKKKNVEFTILELSTLNGPDACDVYKALKESTNGEDITWNFKSYFLIDRAGAVSRYDSVSPFEMREDIEKALAASPSSL